MSEENKRAYMNGEEKDESANIKLTAFFGTVTLVLTILGLFGRVGIKEILLNNTWFSIVLIIVFSFFIFYSSQVFSKIKSSEPILKKIITGVSLLASVTALICLFALLAGNGRVKPLPPNPIPSGRTNPSSSALADINNVEKAARLTEQVSCTRNVFSLEISKLESELSKTDNNVDRIGIEKEINKYKKLDNQLEIYNLFMEKNAAQWRIDSIDETKYLELMDDIFRRVDKDLDKYQLRLINCN